VEGFIVFDYAAQYSAARKDLAQWLSEGKLQRKETIIPGGLEAAEHALVGLYNGINTGMFSSSHVFLRSFIHGLD
jgi:NADPH-dependent curcumin reductase CurA